MSADQHIVQQQHAALQQMLSSGLLDEQFQQLLALQDESNPDFVTEVAELYFDDAVPKIQRVGQLLSDPSPDFAELDAVVHQFKGSSASLGAGGMAKLCIRMRELCQQRDVAGCQALVGQMQEHFVHLQQQLQAYLQLEAQRKHLAGGG